MRDEMLDVELSEQQPYPWARSLLVIVLYLSLLVFLWHFPIEGVRLFFRTLLMGFGYLLAGLVLVGVTFITLTFIPLPFTVNAKADVEASDEWGPAGGGAALDGRVLMIPDLKKPSQRSYVMDIVYDYSVEYDVLASFLVTDTVNGALTIAIEEDEDVGWVLDTLKTHLREADIRVHNPR